MKKNIIEEALEEVVSLQEDDFEKALAIALCKYVKMGYKLSNLSWFKGLNIESLEQDIDIIKQVA